MEHEKILDDFYRGFLLALRVSISGSSVSLSSSEAHSSFLLCLDLVTQTEPMNDIIKGAIEEIRRDHNPIFDRNPHLQRIEENGIRDLILEMEDRTSYFMIDRNEAVEELFRMPLSRYYKVVADRFIESQET